MEEKMAIMVVDDERIVRESFVQWFRKIRPPGRGRCIRLRGPRTAGQNAL